MSTPSLPIVALTRAQFGLRPGDLDEFARLPGGSPEQKLEAWVDRQLSPASIADGDCDVRLRHADLVTLGKSVERLWRDHLVENPYPISEIEYFLWYMRPFTDTRQATLLRAVFSKRQLLEVLVDFWHNHFNVFGPHETAIVVFAHYDRDVIRRHALGNFRAMLEAVATAPAMLAYLDNATNRAEGPNENFARELMELHTLGAEHYFGVVDPKEVPGYAEGRASGYTDHDVREVARCLTGWRMHDGSGELGIQNTGTFLFYPPWHDMGSKVVLGRRIPAQQAGPRDGRDVLDLLAAHAGTARYVCRKLCRRLISDNPPDTLVESAASVFLQHVSAPNQLARVVRHIVLSHEFATTWGEKMRRPFEATAAMLRGLAAEFHVASDLFFYLYDTAGQPLHSRPAPDGFPDRLYNWATSTSLLGRWRLAVALMEGWFADDPAIEVDVATQTPAQANASDAVDFWSKRLLGRVHPDEGFRQRLIAMLAGRAPASRPLDPEALYTRLPAVVELIVMSPAFQWR